MLDLSATLLQAVTQNLCFAWLPPDDVKSISQILNIPEDRVLDMAEPQFREKPSPFNKSSFEKNVTESERNLCVADDFNPYEIWKSTQLLQDFFVSTGRLKCTAPDRPELGPKGVVLHIRSGDIMDPKWPGGYDAQPPCSWYAAVVDEGNNGTSFDHVLIVTEPDMVNPCIATVQQLFPTKVKVQASSVNEDACAIATAQNHATAAWSTFDVGLSRLNPNLRNIYVPFGIDNGTSYYHHRWWTVRTTYDKWFIREEGMPYEQHIYSFQGYNTRWDNLTDRIASMVAYSRKRIIKRTIPALNAWASRTRQCGHPYSFRAPG